MKLLIVSNCIYLFIYFLSIIVLTWRLELRRIRETTFCSQNYCNLSLKPVSNVLLLPGIDTPCKWIGCLILQTSEQQVHGQVGVIQQREMQSSRRTISPRCLNVLFLLWVSLFSPGLHMWNGLKWAAVVFGRNVRNVKPQRGNVSLPSHRHMLCLPSMRKKR